MPERGGDGGHEPLIVVSNRLPYRFPEPGSTEPPRRNVGGLVNALEPVLAERHGLWVGWDGETLQSERELGEALAHPRVIEAESGVRLLGVPLHQQEMERYYHGFSNRTLWPLFHGLVDTTAFRPEYFEAYVEINRRFSEIVLFELGRSERGPGQIWVHDYHLVLVPKLLRERGFEGRIDFFLHIPFPPSEIFRALPWRDRLVEGLLAADSVVFHIEPYRDNFITLAGYLADGRASEPDARGRVVIEHRGGRTIVAAAPIGIDVEAFESLSSSAEVRGEAERIRRAHHGLPILFGADRLDYTKGIVERLHAIERLLTRRPEMAGRFNMVQVVVPSRHQVQEYRELKESLDREVGRINGEWGRPGWVPVHYQYRALRREELVAQYLAAQAALVTPLKDGMNLVAPEFVASRTDDRGVLVLSEFAGVARQLDGALVVNPYDLDGCAIAIERALKMEPAEQRTRMARLRERVRANTVSGWAAACLGMTDVRPHAGPLRVR